MNKNNFRKASPVNCNAVMIQGLEISVEIRERPQGAPVAEQSGMATEQKSTTGGKTTKAHEQTTNNAATETESAETARKGHGAEPGGKEQWNRAKIERHVPWSASAPNGGQQRASEPAIKSEGGTTGSYRTPASDVQSIANPSPPPSRRPAIDPTTRTTHLPVRSICS